MPSKSLAIKEIRDISAAMDADFLRLDWFTHISQSPNSDNERLVYMYFKPVKKFTKSVSTFGFESDGVFTRVKIGVGQLPSLKMGQVWKNGVLLPDYQRGFSKSFRFDTSNFKLDQFVKASDVLGHFNLPDACAYTDCLLFDAVDDNGEIVEVVVPSMELVRFYFCLTSRLSRAIFDGDFVDNLNSLINTSLSSKNGNEAIICRRFNMSDGDAQIVARTEFDEQANRAAKIVYQSMRKSWANYGAAQPKATFPFLGTSQIKANVHILKSDQLTRYLVFSLISCNSDWPFRKLVILADNDPSKAPKETDNPDEEKKPGFFGSKEKRKALKDKEFQSEEGPNSNFNIERKDLPENRFSLNQKIEIIKIEKEKCEYKSAHLLPFHNKNFSDAWSTAESEGSYGSASQAEIDTIVDVNVSRRKSLPPSFQAFTEIIKTINELEGVTFAELRMGPEGEPGLWNAVLVDVKTGKRLRVNPYGRGHWSYYLSDRQHVKGKPRTLRRFMVADIYYAKTHYLLLDVETRPTENKGYCIELIKHISNGNFKEHDMIRMVEEYSRFKGRLWAIKSLPNSMSRVGVGLRHTKQNAIGVADLVLEMLQGSLKG